MGAWPGQPWVHPALYVGTAGKEWFSALQRAEESIGLSHHQLDP